jgi:hypothetical protein
MGIYLNLSGLNGRYVFRVEIVRVNDEEQVGHVESQPIEWRDPLQPFEVGINLPGIALPTFGKYLFRLLSNGALLQDTEFTAHRTAPL